MTQEKLKKVFEQYESMRGESHSNIWNRCILPALLEDEILETDVQVAPGIWQSKEDYEANMAFDEMRDNEL